MLPPQTDCPNRHHTPASITTPSTPDTRARTTAPIARIEQREPVHAAGCGPDPASSARSPRVPESSPPPRPQSALAAANVATALRETRALAPRAALHRPSLLPPGPSATPAASRATPRLSSPANRHSETL